MYHRLLKLSTKSFDQRRYLKDLKQLSSVVDINSEIFDALMNKRPVVALESTIITHGMPHPHNIETAQVVEEIVREQGAVPATIAILRGRIKIGLSPSELTELADGKSKAIKTSRRDFPYVLGLKLNGGTTVASTVICAELCGIKIFATGGIGGVHRNGETTMDISADLVEMGRNPVAVVSSGVKSILDIPRTLEFLETQGVMVSTFQVPDKEFPAFYTRRSGVKAPYNFADALEAAACIDKLHELRLKSGMLIGVPVPEEEAMNESIINNSIKDALAEAERAGIKGKEVTPFILAAISKITAGKSLQTNMSLIKNNAKVAAKISVALQDLQSNRSDGRTNELVAKLQPTTNNSRPVTVIGGSILDVHYRVLDDNLEIYVVVGLALRARIILSFYCRLKGLRTIIPIGDDTEVMLNGATYKSETKFSGGGVGRNIAEGLHKLNGTVSLISAFGNDQNGEFLRKTLPVEATGGSRVCDTFPTANCAVILDKYGDCKLNVGDMTIHGEITPDLIYNNALLIEQSPLICIDANLSLEAIEATLLLARKLKKPVFYEPTDMSIAGKPYELERSCYEQIKFVSPNLYELRKIAETLKISPGVKCNLKVEEVETEDEKTRISLEIADLCEKLHEHTDNIIVTAGSLGVFIKRARNSKNVFLDDNLHYKVGNGNQNCRHYPGKPIDKIVNASGAGDGFCSGFISGMVKLKPEEICVSVGFQAAHAALMSKRAVPKSFFESTHECWSTPAKYNDLN